MVRIGKRTRGSARKTLGIREKVRDSGQEGEEREGAEERREKAVELESEGVGG